MQAQHDVYVAHSGIEVRGQRVNYSAIGNARLSPLACTGGLRKLRWVKLHPTKNEWSFMTLKLPDLPNAYDALEPYMSAETLHYHHDKHHLAYVENGNKLLAGSKYENMSLEDICKNAYADKNAGIVNNVGQQFNHLHFWQWMNKGGGGKKLPGKIETLVQGYGGYDKVRTDFIEAGKSQFGSGWAWLAIKDGKLEVQKTPNGEYPLMHGSKPILGCDVWEHSYYIDYRNARPKYLEVWFDNLINWEHVETLAG